MAINNNNNNITMVTKFTDEKKSSKINESNIPNESMSVEWSDADDRRTPQIHRTLFICFESNINFT